MNRELYRLPASIALYGLGITTYQILKVGCYSDRWVCFWYPVYSWLMCTSADLDVNGRFWKPPKL